MKYAKFYKEAQRQLSSSFISIYAKGKKSYADHLKWIFNHVEEEKFIQPPVFESVFPWEPYSKKMGELTDLLGTSLIEGLDKASFREPLDLETPSEGEDMSFKKSYFPYKHQVDSWKAVLKEHKSIVVTTGTGSGKTECFMVPVLKELLDSRAAAGGQNPGVEAIFLYPLNALIASQRKRIHAWCQAIAPQVTYGSYTSETKETRSQKDKELSYPEIIDRETMRINPPQILLTNSTILEYMMVRPQDSGLIQQSRNLKWIILDEAHTYNGSAAAELAIMIRRVLKLFNKKPSEVNFAITSATIGEGKEEEMKRFIADLTGKDANTDFRFITGKRVVPKLDSYNGLDAINEEFQLHIDQKQLDTLRVRLNTSPALSLDEICDTLKFEGSVEQKLELIDALSVAGSAMVAGKDSAFLPVRAHFFGRAVNGVYACTNPECKRYKENHIDIGSLTTITSQNCPCCGGKMLEVLRCASCGEFLLQGEKIISQDINADAHVCEYQMKDHTISFQHVLDDDDDADTNDDDANNTQQLIKDIRRKYPLLLSVHKQDKPFESATMYNYKLDSLKGIISDVAEGGNFDACNNPAAADYDDLLCPSCGQSFCQCSKMAFGASLEGRLLTHLLLEQSPKTSIDKSSGRDPRVYEGRKYITFTDNRQGTANIAQGANVSVEREWMRSSLLHALLKRYADEDVTNQNVGAVNEEEVKELISFYRNMILTNPELTNRYQKRIAELETQLQIVNNTDSTPKRITTTIDWNYFLTSYQDSKDLKLMKANLTVKDVSDVDYLQSMFLDQMGNKPLRSNSLETLGLVHLCYPTIDEIDEQNVPSVFTSFYRYTDAEKSQALKDWKDFLHICIDYIIRRNTHIYIPENGVVRRLVTQSYFSDPIYASQVGNAKRENRKGDTVYCKKWPKLANIPNNRIPRIPLLMLLAADITSTDQLTEDIISQVNAILDAALRWLIKYVLYDVDNDVESTINGNTYHGFKLNLFDSTKVKLSLIDKVSVCPMTNQLLDYTFRGISPMVKGRLDKRTLEQYKIKQETVTVPHCTVNEQDYSDGGCLDYNQWKTAVNEWFNSEFLPVMSTLGGDCSMQREIFLRRPIYLVSEHSAQIEHQQLRECEKKFEEGSLNILSCSTTMEMGVDIGGISVVQMNNIPPKPANYLQRAGRAGRRFETQSLAFTFCNDTPIGTEVLHNPKWALNHEIEASFMNLSSVTILQRHVNSVFLGTYVREVIAGGATDPVVTSKIGDFIYGHEFEQDRNTVDYNYEGFKKFLTEARTSETLQKTIRDLMKGTAYEYESFDHLLNQSESQINTLVHDYQEKINDIDDKIKTGAERVRNYFRTRKGILWNENLLSYLSVNNFLPSSNMPVNLVDVIGTDDHLGKVQRSLSVALSEYAPGKEIVVSNLVFTIEGIQKRGQLGEHPIEQNISKCSNCGYIALGFNIPQHCPKCGKSMESILHGQRLQSTLAVQPQGFIAGSYKRSKKVNSKGDFLVPDLLGMEPWESDDSNPVYQVRSSVHSDSRILYVNKGKGYGYAFCEACGKMVAENDIAYENNRLPVGMSINHKDILKLKTCVAAHDSSLIKRNVVLLANYPTDIAELQIDFSDFPQMEDQESLLFSLGTIVSNVFTNLIGINESEVWFNITPQGTIFFYDTTPGGAGYANQLPNYIEKVFDLCKQRLSECQCKKACTRCLIDNRSQLFMEKLDKQLVLTWLNKEYESRQIIPQELTSLLGTDTIRKITRNALAEYNSVLNQCSASSIDYFLSEGLSDGDMLDKLSYNLQMANLHSSHVYMVVNKKDAENNKLPMGLRMQLNTYASRYGGLKSVRSCPKEVEPFMYLTYADHTELYVKYNNYLYKAVNPQPLEFVPYEVQLQIEPTDVCFVRNFLDEEVLSGQLMATLMRDDYVNKLKDFLSDKNKHVKVSYTDIYVTSPLACIILSQVIRQFESLFGLTIEEVQVNTGRPSSSYDGKSPWYLNHDYSDYIERNEYLEETLEQNVSAPDIKICDNMLLPHARLLTLVNKEFVITVNPDAGFANGWKAFRENIQTMERDRRKSIKLTNVNYRDQLPIRFTIGWNEK